MTTDDKHLRAEAIHRIKSRNALWRTAGTFVIIWLGLIVVWALSGAGYFWPAWAIGGMAIALVFMAFGTFGPRSSGPTEAQIDAEMKKLQSDAS